jgi:hypothetical protein
LQPRIDVTSRASIKATMKPVLDGCRHAYIWPILQPKIEVSSRVSLKATIQPVLDGVNDAYIWPIFI